MRYPAALALCVVFQVAGVSAAADEAAKAAKQSAADVGSHPRVVQALELARTWLAAQRDYDRLPSLSAAIVHDQKVLWSGAFGFADLEAKRPASADTIYSVCSISKLFTSIAVMQQRDAGKLRLDDPVGKHLTWFALKKKEGEGEVTIEGLLTHASGLPRESDFPYWSAPDHPFPTDEQIREKIKSQAALYEPETRFQYSNLGLTLAGDVAEAAAGVPYADYVRRRILDPLGMTSTTPEVPESEKGKRLATGYTGLDRKGERRPLPLFQTRGIAPAAGFASTANDLARFASWQFRLLGSGGSEVLKATTLREMQRVHWVEPDLKTMWGLGFALRREEGDKFFAGHGGSCPGYRSALTLMPKEKIATIVLVNGQGADTGGYAQGLYSLVAPAIKAAMKPSDGQDATKAPDAGLHGFAGAYDSAGWGGETAVVVWEDGLAVVGLPTEEPMKDMVRLRKTGERRFRRVLPDDSLGEEIVFEMSEDGKPKGFWRHSNFWPRLR